ncbi:ATP-binding protein [Consotaella aegiceratis]|uniref:ATP-binding protein n=1 Tax=Consotaella aegiceratis TaxID=3097961 RepID=UPI002F41050F
MILLPVVEPSQVGAARRRAVQEGRQIGLSDAECDRLAIVATEAATNLLRHAREGEIILVPSQAHEPLGLHVIAVDSGPGLVSIEAALADGYSTAGPDDGGIGGGLGAIRRQADAFDIYSDSAGTTLVATVRSGNAVRSTVIEDAGFTVAKPGFDVGGDAWALRHEGDHTMVMLMDVLGHGAAAARDAELGVAAFCQARASTLEETERRVSAAMVGTRGAAALIVELPHEPGHLRAAGLGNVKGEIHAGADRRGIPSAPGIVGSSSRRPTVTEHDWPAGALLVLSTDGLRGSERTPDPTPLFVRNPMTIAATLYRRRRRGTDDCGVVVLRGRE